MKQSLLRMTKAEDELIPTRATLLERLKDPLDGKSWQDFFDTYWKLLFLVARKAGLGDMEAQDAVQEVMIAVAKDIPNFKYDPARGSFKAWLLIRARWKIIEQFRKRKISSYSNGQGTTTGHGGIPCPIASLPDPASLVPDDFWENEWRENLYTTALSKVKVKLDPEKAQIFDYYVTKGWKAEKVAAIFQVSVDHVYLTKHRVAELIEAEVRRLERETT